jgi:hypothetical protein
MPITARAGRYADCVAPAPSPGMTLTTVRAGPIMRKCEEEEEEEEEEEQQQQQQ